MVDGWFRGAGSGRGGRARLGQGRHGRCSTELVGVRHGLMREGEEGKTVVATSGRVSVTPLVLPRKQLTKPRHEHHVYVLLHVAK
jgi:hypothetical protein